MQLPLMAEPQTLDLEPTRTSLCAWLDDHREAWETDLLRHGAILFRGFTDITSASDFEEVAKAVSPRLMGYVGGTTSRSYVSGNIATSTDYPPLKRIALHQEMSYTDIYPDKLMFFCEKAPFVGGRTPLADMRRVYARLSPRVRDEFERRRIRLIRTLSSAASKNERSWPKVFGSPDPAEVDAIARRHNWSVEWLPAGDLRLKQEVRDASTTHPITGDRVWFNQAGYGTREQLIHTVLRPLLKRTGRDQAASGCFFGDGAEIPLAYRLHISWVLRQETRSFKWRRCDVLLIDNVLVAHGRSRYLGPRRILAALIRDRQVATASGSEFDEQAMPAT